MPTGLMQDIIKAFKHTPWLKCTEIVGNTVHHLPTDCYWWRRAQIYSPVLQITLHILTTEQTSARESPVTIKAEYFHDNFEMQL